MTYNTVTDYQLFLFVCSDGVVSMGEYMSFMISRETENVGSSQEVINAFKALTEGGKRPYVTEAELYQVICTTLLVYCRNGLECNRIAEKNVSFSIQSTFLCFTLFNKIVREKSSVNLVFGMPKEMS